jgi:hypothetical protein
MTRDPPAVANVLDFSPAASGSASERAAPTDYSTMSTFVLLMKPNTSARSAAGTSKVSRVVSRWPIKRYQSLSLMPIPRCEVFMSRPT